jgi:hypothetical protein
MSYKDMLNNDRNIFKGAGVLVADAQELTEFQKMEIFLRYNSTGKPQSPEHLEKVRALLNKLRMENI